MIIPQFPHRRANTELILRPEYIHPALNRKARRKHLKIKIKHYHHVTPTGDIYEKAADGDTKVKDARYGGKFR